MKRQQAYQYELRPSSEQRRLMRRLSAVGISIVHGGEDVKATRRSPAYQMFSMPDYSVHNRAIEQRFLPRLIRTLSNCVILCCCLIPTQCLFASPIQASVESGARSSDLSFDHTHYLIPGFSNHLIDTNLIIHRDLQIAKRAAIRHNTLRLRIALADANGHLLQMATPPALAGLRDQIVIVADDLIHPPPPRHDSPWDSLLSSIRRLPMPSADKSARTLLNATAQKAQSLAQSGKRQAARAQIIGMISEIEITAHVFPINHLRHDIKLAIDAASHDNPRWQHASNAIEKAMTKTQWLLHSDGRNLIKAYDFAVAAYTEWPKVNASRASLRQSYWYLRHARKARQLTNRFLAASRNNELDLPTIAHLQHVLALYIHRSRDIASESR